MRQSIVSATRTLRLGVDSAKIQQRASILRLLPHPRGDPPTTRGFTMRTKRIIAGATAAAIAASLLASAGLVSADGLRQNEVRALRESGKILPMEDILKQVRQIQPGQVVEIELDRDKDAYVYEVKVIDQQDRIHKLELDAGNGEVLRRKER